MGNGPEFTVFVDIILIRISEPQVHADGVHVLIMTLPSGFIMVQLPVICVCDKNLYAFTQVPGLIIKYAECLTQTIGVIGCKLEQHGPGIIITGCEQVIGFCECFFQHTGKICCIDIPAFLKMLNGFPLVAFISPVIRQITQVGVFDFP